MGLNVGDIKQKHLKVPFTSASQCLQELWCICGTHSYEVAACSVTSRSYRPRTRCSASFDAKVSAPWQQLRCSSDDLGPRMIMIHFLPYHVIFNLLNAGFGERSHKDSEIPERYLGLVYEISCIIKHYRKMVLGSYKELHIVIKSIIFGAKQTWVQIPPLPLVQSSQIALPLWISFSCV